MKSVTTLLCLLTMSLYTYSQTMVRDQIRDDNGFLPGANIIIKHTQKGTVSDFDGNYEIEAKATDTLSISYMGYKTFDVLIGKQTEINSILTGYVELDAVEIMAYGTRSNTDNLYCGNHVLCKMRCVTSVSARLVKNFKSNIIKESLYPNPSRQGVFKLRLLQDYKNVQVQVSNMSGQIILLNDYKQINKTVNIDLSNQPAGIYIINILADGKQLPAKKAIIG